VPTLRIIIRMDNDAFAEAEGQETARILELLAEEYKDMLVIPRERLPLFDGNGNTVGEATVLR
jgi:hypothetical protein